MTKTNLMTAANEYANRPADEKFPSLSDMIEHASDERRRTKEVTYPLADLRVAPVGNGVVLESPNAQAKFTHWSFGQLSRSVGAPAGYLRTLPPTICASALNHGLQNAPGQRANVLVRKDADGGLTARAATSDTYSRLWDADLFGAVNRHFGDGVQASDGGTWQAPPTWAGGIDGPRGGTYRGDRTSFVLRIDGGSILEDPRRGWQGNGRLNRGLMISNSEVGAGSVSIDMILFDVICGNHILWGAVIDRTFRRRHVGAGLVAKVVRELLTLARKYNERSASEDARIIRTLTTMEVAATDEGIISELRGAGFTAADAKAAYERAQVAEPDLNPRSYWGLAAGITRLSQDSGYQDERANMDRLAAAILAKGRQLVTV